MKMSRTPQKTVAEQVVALLTQHGMLAGVKRLGLAVSGGSDSVALLRLLLPICRAEGITPVVLHFDHGLRGAASAADARFVERLAGKLGVECQVSGVRCEVVGVRRGAGSATDIEHEKPTTYHRTPPTQSLEMSARVARQTFFRDVARQAQLDAIATGHTADDVAETLLLRLARGSGATGLSGLRPVHTVTGVKYVRPLLGCAHAKLRAWLRRQRQIWREDASNRDENIPRNRVRHTVLPWLEQNWSPSIRAMMVQSASILRDEDALLEELARKELDQCSPTDGPTVRLSDGITIASTLHLPPATLPLALQRRVIRQWLMAAGHPEAAGWGEVDGILAKLRERSTWQVVLPGNLLLRAKGGRLQLVEAAQGGGPRVPERGLARPRSGRATSALSDYTELPVPGRVIVAGVRVSARRSKGIVRTPGPVGVLPSACSLDAASLLGKKLLVRTRRPGDRIQPLGLDGSKTLQDLFVDAKIPVEQRDRIPLLVVDDEVVWVPGYRVAKAFAVRGPTSASVRVEMKVIGHLSLGKKPQRCGGTKD